VRAGDSLARHLADAHDAEVVGVSHHLADRPRLRADLDAAPAHDVVLSELKAAAVDVVLRSARDRGTDAVIYDHAAVTLEPPAGIDPTGILGDVADGFDAVLAAADRRHGDREEVGGTSR
jgi:predicted GTPase